MDKDKILDAISKMSVMELVDLISAVEEKFGVSAASAVAVAAAPAAGGDAGSAEKTDFDVVLTAVGDKKINVIKAVRAITGLGLKEAKEMVDGAPVKVKEAVAKDEAEKIQKELTEAGATVDLK